MLSALFVLMLLAGDAPAKFEGGVIDLKRVYVWTGTSMKLLRSEPLRRHDPR